MLKRLILYFYCLLCIDYLLIETYSLYEDTKTERNGATIASKNRNQLKYMGKSPIFLYNVCVLNETKNNLGLFTPFHKN